MVNAKSPSKKRKSVGGQNAVSPKIAKIEGTPGKATPGKTPKPNFKKNKSPKCTPNPNFQQNKNKLPQGTPKPDLQQKNGKGTPGQKKTPMKKFEGTGKVFEKKTEQKESKVPEGKPKKQPGAAPGGKKVKKGRFHNLREKASLKDPNTLSSIEKKIKSYEAQKELTKTARRKLKMLLRLKGVITGEGKVPQVKKDKVKQGKKPQQVVVNEEGVDQPKKNKKAKGKKGSKVTTAVVKEEDDEDTKSDKKLGKFVKVPKSEGDDEESTEDEEAESGDEDEAESGEEEEAESGEEEEAESGEEEEEEGDESGDEEEIGGKKKGEEKKNQVKAKNFKLQAMRKQGQLAGSVKEENKRSRRRAKKNTSATGPTNGS